MVQATVADTIHYSILASGSGGNATYLETAGHRILIDAGLSGKQLEQRMEAIGRSLDQVEALFVTHEHSDHSHGVGGLGAPLWNAGIRQRGYLGGRGGQDR